VISGGTNIVATNPVSDPANAAPANKGIIEDRSDIDLFYVDAGGGTVDLSIKPAWIAAYKAQSRRGTNLDIRAALYDEFGQLVAESNPFDNTSATISASVSAGRYILAVEGVGELLSGGYSDYASIGQYFKNAFCIRRLLNKTVATGPVLLLLSCAID
jgi:hypothetical protein